MKFKPSATVSFHVSYHNYVPTSESWGKGRTYKLSPGSDHAPVPTRLSSADQVNKPTRPARLRGKTHSHL